MYANVEQGLEIERKATNDEADFARYPGVSFENWFATPQAQAGSAARS